MGLLAKRRESRAKLLHARSRVAELLPLCEQTIGITLKKPFSIERSSRMKHAFRYAMGKLRAWVRSSKCDTRYLASKELSKKLRGYFDTKRRIFGVNLGLYTPGHAMSEYTIIHEIMHALFDQYAVSSGIYKDLGPDTIRLLGEGAATYYGDIVAGIVVPGFDILSNPSLDSIYSDGHEFFRSIAAMMGDPLVLLKDDPPREWWTDDNGGRWDTEVRNTNAYVERLRGEHPLKSRRPSSEHP